MENENEKYVRRLAESAKGHREEGVAIKVERLGGYLDGLKVAESTKLKLHNLFFRIVDGKEGGCPSSI